jgi:hypothetical protein
MSTPLAMLHPELLDPNDIQTISRDGLIMAPNRKVDLLTRNVAKASYATVPVVRTASGGNKLKAGSRLLVSPFPEIKFILSCCGVL